MFKNNTHKLNKFLFSTFVLCILALFSACLLLSNSKNSFADVYTIDVNRSFVANDYIFEDDLQTNVDLDFANDNYLPDVGDIDVSGKSYYCLRDDYVIYTQDQYTNGLCWAFASSMALGTTMMVSTGQFYDFSEAWIGLARLDQVSSYIFGDGGNANYFNSVFSSYGLVLESDLTYEKSYLINRENYSEYLDYYSRYANTTLYDNIDTVSYINVNQDQIKNHIYNHGALSISMFWNTAKGESGVVWSDDGYAYKYPSAKEATTGGHAITLIGWDDQISITVNGKVYTGAWICLNSWGEDVVGDDDGILYVFYDDTDLYGTVYGYKYNPTSSELYFNNNIKAGTGYTTYQTNLKGKYYTGFSATTNLTKQQNIYFDNDVNITYEYNITSNAKIDAINIFYGEEDVTIDFDIFIDTENKEYTIKANDLPYGPYKILVQYSNASQTEEYCNIIYVNNDANISNLYTYYSSSNSGISNNGNFFVYGSYNYKDIVVNIATTKSSGSFSLYYTGTSYSFGISNSYFSIRFSGINANNPLYVSKQKITSGTNNVLDIVVNVMFVENAATYKLVNVYYGLNGGINSEDNFSREIFSTTDGLNLSEPTRKGFNFEGWYYDADFTQPITLNQFDFNKVIQIGSNPTCYTNTPKNNYYKTYFNNSNISFVYAKWSLKEPTGATLKSTSKTLAFAQSYTISVDSIIHDLSKMMTIESIDWYLGGEKLKTTTVNELTQVATAYGAFTYYAVITVSYREQTVVVVSQDLNVIVLDSVSEVSYSNGAFSWSEVETSSEYIVSLYLTNENASEPSLITKTIQTETYFTLLDKVSIQGNYYVMVSALLIVGGQEYPSAEITSNPVAVFEVSYVTYDTAMNSIFVDGQTAVNNQIPQERPGYIFNNWCTDDEKTVQFTEGSTITESITLYANWTLKDIIWSLNVTEIQKYYDENESDITVTASHESGNNQFIYTWYYDKNLSNDDILLDEDGFTIKVKEVSDSGYYFCIISFTDSEGLFNQVATDYVYVEILKSPTSINTDYVKKDFEYTGEPQVIDTGALLLDNQGKIIEGVEFTYTLYGDDGQEIGNSFVNVPLGGEYKLKISTDGIDNYSGATADVYIKVRKAKSEIIISKPWQTYRYTGRPVQPSYEIGNTEQTIDEQSFPINFGEYDITLVAPETQNYERITEQMHISIAKANIRVKANDVTSILFFAPKELTYSIYGEVFEGDDLNLQLHAEVDTGKLGKYDINVTFSNENYQIALEHGTYTVTGWPYYIVIGIILLIIYIIIKVVAKRRYQYDFETNGGNIVSPIDTKRKKELILENPIKEGYNFVGWYTDIELTKPFTQKFVKSKGKTLYAKWQKNIYTDQNVSQEQVSVQQIVDDINEKLNPKQIEQIQENLIIEQTEEPKELTEQEKMQEIISSININDSTLSNTELEDFIKNITDKN